ncbi:DUF3613 domain-containing protein [Pandoraea anhela]|uniref:DUF3613 domain-containing protein n=1 Tax=Pandoraea anhela TaxID=2508295 RepID=A0A5E4RYK9_9BURK|nr:DUF3613 domain-containing protein [Pandoraea anhela]VVD67524.1 hypothetical protein PAN31108_00438 [Pandoraea anhela]
MAGQTLQEKSGARLVPVPRTPRSARFAQIGLAVFALCSGGAVAQSNTPLTGAMGGDDARAVASPSATTSVTSSVTPALQPSVQTFAQASAVAGTSGQAPVAQEAARTPSNVVRRTAPPRVGEPARDGMLGDETEALLAVQRNNLAAGPGLPMLGATASRAYRRYLDSFNYPIPAFFATMIQSDGVGGGGGGGGGAPATSAGAGASQ